MNLEEIKELMGIMRKNKMKEVEVEQKGVRVRIVAMPSPRSGQASDALAMHRMTAAPYMIASAVENSALPAPKTSDSPSSAAMAPASAEGAAATVAETEEQGIEIKSPMVGTFYRAPAPDAPSYVEPGSVVNKESVLCIIEAMKLMNEIKAEVRGKILKVLVENGQPVEFNQPLFLMEAF